MEGPGQRGSRKPVPPQSLGFNLSEKCSERRGVEEMQEDNGQKHSKCFSKCCTIYASYSRPHVRPSLKKLRRGRSRLGAQHQRKDVSHYKERFYKCVTPVTEP